MDFYAITIANLFLNVLYIGCTLILFVCGLNRIILSVLYLITKRKVWNQAAPPSPTIWPNVTVQLPIFNEQYMVKRLLKAVSKLDYPKDKLQIQILDDSTDSTSELLHELTGSYRKMGFNLDYVRRKNRQGYKAGALENGLQTATGDFTAILDADFVPTTDWLKKMIPFFNDPKIAFVQSRWIHLNNKFNILTRLEALTLDGHFVVEQSARVGSGLMMSFNGAGGIWRKAAIEDAGGWQSDTLTEDLDLSLRAQVKGWKYRYLPSVTVLSELPVQIDAFKKQQFRWSKGFMQTTRKMLGKILVSNLPLPVKLMGALQLFGTYPVFPFILLSILLILPVGLYSYSILFYFSWTLIATLGTLFFFCLAKSEHFPNFWGRLVALCWIMVFGAGLSVVCSAGVVAGLFRSGGVFERTPKLNVINASSGNNAWGKSKYVLKINPVLWAEMAVGIYLLASLYILWPTVGRMLAPWLMMSATGFFTVAGMTLQQYLQRARGLMIERE